MSQVQLDLLLQLAGTEQNILLVGPHARICWQGIVGLFTCFDLSSLQGHYYRHSECSFCIGTWLHFEVHRHGSDTNGGIVYTDRSLSHVGFDAVYPYLCFRRRVETELSPGPAKRKVVEQSCREPGASERKACKVLGQARSTQRYKPRLPDKDKPVIDDSLVLHVKHPRYGYRRITIKLREKGWEWFMQNIHITFLTIALLAIDSRIVGAQDQHLCRSCL